MFEIIVRKDSTARLNKGIELYLKKISKKEIVFQKWKNLSGFRTSWSKDYPKEDVRFKFGNKTIFAQFQENPNYVNNGFGGKICVLSILNN